ncbi:uncharacterized protein LAESUDRAFT_83983 [Laetiporus sulphureus 93-53]|uniref:DUF6534 domain-containing protein n=1 Tax=Laetiporus sulphureus 93-53 TaxID=1314785 RepID=A0A165F328_9APHY|nr:uncharacterized protein LAESUDRAFT_83983 [Laetiporus sulphureus 93-53]KZT08273.1 hypothetical protein LAESUDRAFT_83983 [Laetiporus sulphureus 93-53]
MFFSFILYGATLAQTCFYFHRYTGDRIGLKALVAFIWLLDTARKGIMGQLLWYTYVQNHANIESLSKIDRAYGVEHALATATIFTVQCFYLRTFLRLLPTHRLRIPVVICGFILVVASLAGSIGVIYEVYSNPTDQSVFVHVNVPGRVQSFFALASDVYITTSLFCILYTARSSRVNSTTTGILSRLIGYTLHRGILLCIVQVLQIATYTETGSELTDVFYFPSSTLYANTLLAVLNARQHVREVGADCQDHYSIPLATIRTEEPTS